MTTAMIVSSLIVTKLDQGLDYCNSLLAGCTKLLKGATDTQLFCTSYVWWRQSKLWNFACWCTRQSVALCYLNELCIPVSTVPNRVVRSAARGNLFVPRTRLQLGNRAFCATVRSPGTVSHFTFVSHPHLHVFDQKGSQAFSITNYGNGYHIHE